MKELQGLMLCVVFALSNFGLGLEKSKKDTLNHAAEASLPDMIDRARDQVVQVSAYLTPSVTSRGTGFFVNTDGVVVTALHVVLPSGPSQPPAKITISLRVPTLESGVVRSLGSWHVFPSNIVAIDPAHDVAVIKPINNPFTAPPYIEVGDTKVGNTPLAGILDPHRLRDGESVFVSGYPLELPILITTSGALASSDPMSFDPGPPMLKVQDVYWVDLHANPGNSGGPLFSRETGRIIGILLKYVDAPVVFGDVQSQGFGVSQQNNTVSLHPLVANSGIAIVLSIKHVIEFLDRQTPPIKYDIKKGP